MQSKKSFRNGLFAITLLSSVVVVVVGDGEDEQAFLLSGLFSRVPLFDSPLDVVTDAVIYSTNFNERLSWESSNTKNL